MRYLIVSLIAGLATFLWRSGTYRLSTLVLLFDAAGLALFAVAGTEKSLAFGLNPVAAALMGMRTGIGGGMMRDLLQVQIPIVLRADLYAMAALAAATVVIVGHMLQLPAGPCALAGAALCFGMRVMAIRYGWRLPVARSIGNGKDRAEPRS